MPVVSECIRECVEQVNAFTRRSPGAVTFSWLAKTFTVRQRDRGGGASAAAVGAAAAVLADLLLQVVLELAHFIVTMLMSVGIGANPLSVLLLSLSSLSSTDEGGGGEEGGEGCDYPFSLWFRTATVTVMGGKTMYDNGKQWWQQRERKKEWVSPDISEDAVTAWVPCQEPWVFAVKWRHLSLEQQAAAQALGYDENGDAWDEQNLPDTMKKAWKELEEEERDAAIKLGTCSCC